MNQRKDRDTGKIRKQFQEAPYYGMTMMNTAR